MKNRRLSREEHGDKYDYSQVVYTGIHNKVDIICPIHRKFSQSANSHKRGFAGLFYDLTAKPSDYHLNKYLRCKENGVDLIHIFDIENINEWYEKLSKIRECQVSFENVCREYYPRKSVCLKVYGKSIVA